MIMLLRQECHEVVNLTLDGSIRAFEGLQSHWLLQVSKGCFSTFVTVSLCVCARVRARMRAHTLLAYKPLLRNTEINQTRFPPSGRRDKSPALAEHVPEGAKCTREVQINALS